MHELDQTCSVFWNSWFFGATQRLSSRSTARYLIHFCLGPGLAMRLQFRPTHEEGAPEQDLLQAVAEG
jgi:hypothetical protein